MNNNPFKTWKFNKNLDLPDEKHRNHHQNDHQHPENYHHNEHHQIIERKRIPSALKSADLIVKKANYEHFFTTMIKSKQSAAAEPDDSVSLMNTLTMPPKQPYLPSQQLQQQPTLVALKKHRHRNHRRLKRKLQTIKTNYNHEQSSLRSSILKLQLNHDPNTINNHTNQSKRIGIPTSLFDAIEKFLNNLQ